MAKEQPLNVEIGKSGSDALFRRRDKAEANRNLIAQSRKRTQRPPHPSDELTVWLEENLGGDWISELDRPPV